MSVAKLKRILASLCLIAAFVGCNIFRESSEDARKGADGAAEKLREEAGNPGKDSGGAAPENRDNQAPKIEDLGPLGGAARGLLRPEPFTEIRVEIGSVEGREPSSEVIGHLKKTFEGVARKKVSVVTTSLARGDGSWSADEIRSASRSRTSPSRAPVASIWIGFLNGSLEEEDNALGVAVSATVAAVFPDRIGTISALLQPDGVTKAVVIHELGHLLALVNIGYKSAIDREDPKHRNHSRNQDSVMYWAVEDISVANIFRGGPPDDFDPADRADLERFRSS